MDWFPLIAPLGSGFLGVLVGGFWTNRTAKQNNTLTLELNRQAHEESLRVQSLEPAKTLLGIYKDMDREFRLGLADRVSGEEARELFPKIWNGDRERQIEQERHFLTDDRTRRVLRKIDAAFMDMYMVGHVLKRVDLHTAAFLTGDALLAVSLYIRGTKEVQELSPGLRQVDDACAIASLRPSHHEVKLK